jgi:hypothetical protein
MLAGHPRDESCLRLLSSIPSRGIEVEWCLDNVHERCFRKQVSTKQKISVMSSNVDASECSLRHCLLYSWGVCLPVVDVQRTIYMMAQPEPVPDRDSLMTEEPEPEPERVPFMTEQPEPEPERVPFMAEQPEADPARVSLAEGILLDLESGSREDCKGVCV